MTFLLILLFSGWATSYIPFPPFSTSPEKLTISPTLPANLFISIIAQNLHTFAESVPANIFFSNTLQTVAQHPPTTALDPKHSSTKYPTSTFFIESPSPTSTLSLSSCPWCPRNLTDPNVAFSVSTIDQPHRRYPPVPRSTQSPTSSPPPQ